MPECGRKGDFGGVCSFHFNQQSRLMCVNNACAFIYWSVFNPQVKDSFVFIFLNNVRTFLPSMCDCPVCICIAFLQPRQSGLCGRHVGQECCCYEERSDVAPAAHRGILRYISPSHTHTHTAFMTLCWIPLLIILHMFSHTHIQMAKCTPLTRRPPHYLDPPCRAELR